MHGVRTAAAAGCRVVVLTNGCGGLEPGVDAGHAGAHQRPHQPHRRVAAARRDVHRPHRPLLRAAAGAVPRDRAGAGRGRLRAVPRAAVRDPGRGADGRASSAPTSSGMSTALEAIAAREAGLEILGLSLVTNLAAGMTGEPLNHEEVLEAGQGRRRAHGPPARAGGGLAVSADGVDRCSTAPGPGSTTTPTPTRGRARPPARRRGQRRRGRGGRAARRLRRPARVRHRRPARRARARPQPDEPRGRHPRGRRSRRLPAARTAAARCQWSSGYDARHKSDAFARDTAEVMEGAGIHALRAAAPAADAGARVRDPPPRLRGRRDGDREPQPAAGQRLQGLPRRRHPDRAAGRRRDQRRASTRSAPCATCRAATAGRRLDDAVLDGLPRRRRRAGRRRRRRATSRIAYTPMHGVGGDVVLDGPAPRRVPGTARGRRAVRARPRLPDGVVPQPGGAGRDGPRARGGHRGRRRRRHRQRPGRRPLRGRGAHARPRGARRPAYRMLRGDEVGWLLGWWLHERGAARRLRELDRVVVAAVDDGRGLRPRARGDAHRLQVDRAHPRPGLRLRGGARLLRRLRAGGRQGRRERRAARRRDGGGAARRRGARCTTCSTTSRVAHGLHATDQLSVRVDDLSLISRRHGTAARRTADRGRRARGRDVRRPRGRRRRPAAHRRRPAAARARARAWSCARAAPSPSSSATSRSSCRSPPPATRTATTSRPRSCVARPTGSPSSRPAWPPTLGL